MDCLEPKSKAYPNGQAFNLIFYNDICIILGSDTGSNLAPAMNSGTATH